MIWRKSSFLSLKPCVVDWSEQRGPEKVPKVPYTPDPSLPRLLPLSCPLTPVASHNYLWLYFVLKNRLAYVQLNDVNAAFSCGESPSLMAEISRSMLYSVLQ